MPANPTTQQMGELHEEYLAAINSGTKTRASGSQWFDQGDGRNVHESPLAFCWDGKSTLGKSIAVTRDMLAKIREQAQGERPQIGLRFYGNGNLDVVDEDWVAVPGDNWEEVLNAGRLWIALTEGLLSDPQYSHLRESDDDELFEVIIGLIGRPREGGLREALAEAHTALVNAGQHIARQDLELEDLRAKAGAQRGPGVPPEARQHVPRLPWTIIHTTSSPAPGVPGACSGVAYDPSGFMTAFQVSSVRVEHSGKGRPLLFADDMLVRDGDLIQDGRLTHRVCASDPAIEVG